MNQNARGNYKVDKWFAVLTIVAAILIANIGAVWLLELLGFEVTVPTKIVSGAVCGVIGGVVTGIVLNVGASLLRRKDDYGASGDIHLN